MQVFGRLYLNMLLRGPQMMEHLLKFKFINGFRGDKKNPHHS